MTTCILYCVHIEYIARFYEVIFVLTGLRLTTYVRVVGIMASTYCKFDEISRLWSVLWKVGNGPH